MAGIFKAYDIRGVYGKTIDEDTVERIARAFVTLLRCRKVVVGRDVRSHSEPLFHALSRGLTQQGANVVDLGRCSTPMSYFANGRLNADAGIMITASHNPPEWNGLKLSRGQAVPISGDTGIAEIERIVRDAAFDPPAAEPGTVTRHDVSADYAAFLVGRARLARPVRVVADMANAMGIAESRGLRSVLDLTPLFDEYDGSCPNHEANPLLPETLDALRRRVVETGADFGVAFDGDADRVGFVDETGGIVPMDAITALIASDLLEREKGTILYDLRSSWAVREIIAERGGTPVMCRVGHAFIKQQMRDHNALFAGELSGHYYFRDNFFTESSGAAVLCVANIVSRADEPLSALARRCRRYAASGEINSTVADPEAVLARILERHANGRVLRLDGVSVEYDDWWFNVRKSNTEPLVRLNVEARTREALERRRDELLAMIRAPA